MNSSTAVLANVAIAEEFFPRPIESSEILYKVGDLRVKIIRSDSFEFEKIRQLRDTVFRDAYGISNSSADPFSNDPFDTWAYHLAVEDTKNHRIVGTYRAICHDDESSFYSATEFHLNDILNLKGGKIELSRACIDPEYRSGTVISLLWRGISELVKEHNAKWLFGLGSIKGLDPLPVAKIIKHLQLKDQLINDLVITPQKDFKIENFENLVEDPSHEDLENVEIPSLLRSYLSAGALIAPNVAIDRGFNCIDLFTLLNLEKVTPIFSRRFLS